MQIWILLTMLTLMLAGCGDLKDNKVVKKELESERFRVDCVMDVNAFTDILKKNISSDIKCLEENLNLFIKVVKTDRQGHLSRESLEQFVIKNRPDIKPEMIRAMKAIFDVNYLITGEDPGYISSENVKRLIEFALVFNERSSQHFYNTLGNTRKTPLSIFKVQRSIVIDVTRELIVAVRKIFNSDRGDEIHKLNILDLLDSFTTDDNRADIEKAKKLLFAKKFLLGGNPEEISHKEVDFFITNLQSLMPVLFDGLRLRNVYLKKDSIDANIGQDYLSQSALIDYVQKDLSELNDLINDEIFASRDQEVLFTIDELLDSVKLFVEKDDLDIDKFANIGREAKKILMGGNLVDIRAIEIKKLFEHAKSLLRTGDGFHLFYNNKKIKELIDSPKPITVNITDYNLAFPGYNKELAHFDRIAKRYRFYIGENEIPYYHSGFSRNVDGMFEIYAMEYLIKMMFQTFGAPSPNSTNAFGYSMDQFQMQALFKKFQKDLINLDLLSPLWPTITTDNVSLLGTLFQLQSDDNKVMDVNEATEFGINLFSSMAMTDKLFDHFKKKGCEFDEFGRIEPTCMKANYFQALCSEYRSHLPLMFSSINTPASCENIPMNQFNTQFLERSARASRPCMNYTDGEKEEIYYSESDVNTMVMVMLHSEITVIKWDKNGDNILDAAEVNQAYTIYGPALDGFLVSKPAIIQKFKKQIYQYLIKYEEVPDEKKFKSIWKFIKFLMSFDKNSSATRKTITSVLMAIGEENAKLPTAPQIDCNYLRDPNNIPRASGSFSTEIEDLPDYSGLLHGFVDYID